MHNSNGLSGVVLLAVSALEDARSWDYKGVTSQDVAMLRGMTIHELSVFAKECQDYSQKRARQWLDERKEQEVRYQEWIKNCPPPTNCAICEARNLALDRWQARMEADQERDRISE